VLCCALLCYALLCSALLCSALLCATLWRMQYRYFTGETIWPFGRGLTFTNWTLSQGQGWPAGAAATFAATSDPSSAAASALSYRVAVRNTGAMDSDVVVTAYWSGGPSGLMVRTPIQKQVRKRFFCAI
jgi:hypothetical protein